MLTTRLHAAGRLFEMGLLGLLVSADLAAWLAAGNIAAQQLIGLG